MRSFLPTAAQRRRFSLLTLLVVLSQVLALPAHPTRAASQALPRSPHSAQAATPTPPPTPTVTPNIVFDLSDSALCRAEPGWITVEGTITLPLGQQALFQTVWYIVHPDDLRTDSVYSLSGPYQNGARVQAQFFWPGIRPADTVVESHLGAMLLDPLSFNPIMPSGASLDHYWYPWVCPAPTPAPTVTPTLGPPSITPTATDTPTPTPTTTSTIVPTSTPAPTATPLPSLLRDAHLTLVPSLAGPNVVSTTQTLSATLTNAVGHPLAGQTVQFQITGVHTQTLSASTDALGQATVVYTGTLRGDDIVVARAADAVAEVRSNEALVHWITPLVPIATTTVLGRFFRSDGSGAFTATPNQVPAFSQAFPTITFNPPLGTVPGATTGYDERPMVNVTTDLTGTFTGAITAEGNGYQAGVGPMEHFNAVFTGEFVVKAAGDVTFRFFNDDGFIFGVGNGATRVSGANLHPPLSGRTPFANLPWMGDFNDVSAPNGNAVIVHFPAPGRYPYEVDYSECCAGELVLTMTAVGSGGIVGIPPSGVLTLTPTRVEDAATGQPQTLSVQALDASGVPQAGVPVVFAVRGANTQQVQAVTDADGRASFTYTGANPGPDTVQAFARMGLLPIYSGQATIQWQPVAAPPQDAPLAVPGWIASPLNQAHISAPVPVTLASSVTLTDGTLRFWPVDHPEAVTTLATGLHGTGGSTLATFDPTLVANGSYIIELTGTDSAGVTLSSGVLVVVQDTEYKPGRVRLSETDLAIPLTGLPISVGRTYDSLERGFVSDFGHGWSLSLGNPRLSVDAAHNVTFTQPNGKRVTFGFTPRPDTWIFSAFLRPAYTPTPGVYGTLTADGCPLVVRSSDQYLCFLDQAAYRPTTYTYTDPYGRVYTMGADGRLRSVKDVSGNTLTITPNGITSSAGGLTVPFTRDSQGRITEITDPAGKVYHYAYDAAGDLVSVSLPELERPLAYTYVADHLLRTVTNARGITVSATQYFGDGRVKQETDGAGNTIQYAYDLLQHTTTITNPDAGVQVQEFDTYGALVRQTDPLGRVTRAVYDDRHQLTSRTDARGQTSTYTYDDRGNVTSVTDPLHHTIQVTYTPFNSPLQLTSPDHITATVRYNDQQLPDAVTDALGTLVSAELDTHGNITARTDGAGNTTRLRYDPYGNLVEQRDPRGYPTSFTYDALGRRTSQVDPLGQTTRFTYDALGRRLTWTDPLSQTTRSTYDGAGNLTEVRDAAGQLTSYRYDGANRLTEIRAADGGITTITSNWRGQRLTLTDPNGRVTRYGYDLAGQLTQVTVADGTPAAATTTYAYDATGHLTRQTDPLSHTTTYAYDEAGQRISVTDALTQTTTYRYSDRGQIKEQIDPLGHHTWYTYDQRGRLVATDYQIWFGSDHATSAYDGAGRLTRSVDPSGRATEYTYNASGQLVATTVGAGTPDATTTTTQYDPVGRPIAARDAFGHTTSLDYDAAGRLIQRTDPLSHSTRYAHDALGRTTVITDALDRVTQTRYDPLGRVRETLLPDGSRAQQDYDLSGALLSRRDPLGVLTTFGYDAAGRLESTTIAAGTPLARTTRTVYDRAGRPTQQIDPLGHITRTTYDAVGQVIASTNALTQTTAYGYDAAGNLRSITDARSHTTSFTTNERNQRVRTTYPDGSQTEQGYDGAGRLIRTVNERGIVTTLAYDGAGRLLSTYRDGGLFEKQFTQTRYDQAGRPVQRIDPLGRITTTHYDDAGWVIGITDPLSRTTTYDYDAAGQRTAQHDANGHTTGYTYDALGRLITTTLPDGRQERQTYDAASHQTSRTDAAGRTTILSYDGLGQLLSVTDPLSQTTRYEYNGAGQRTSVRDPLGHTTQTEYDVLGRLTRVTWPDGRQEEFGYDAVGNRTSHLQADGQTVLQHYDARDRLERTIFPDGEELELTYIATGQRRSLVRHTAAGAETTWYTYDGLERLTDFAQPNGLWLHSTYNVADERTELVTPAGTTRYTYDAGGQLRTVGDPWGGTSSYTYDAVGNVTQRVLPNGVTTEYGYNDRDQLTDLTHRQGTTVLASEHYTLGATGERQAVASADGRQTSWAYDAAGRLLSEQEQAPGQLLSTTSYTYDAAGNRRSQIRDGVTTTYQYNANDQLESAGSRQYRYDGRGNLTEVEEAGQITRYRYDSANQLVRVTLPNGQTAQYRYGADGQRIAQTIGGVTTDELWDQADGGQIVAERGPNGALTGYALGRGERLGQQRNGERRYALSDGTGSVRLLTDAQGQITDRYRYRAFGEPSEAQGNTVYPFRYTGEQYDGLTELYNLRARFYDPGQGRFLSRDTWPLDAQNPVELNRYVYARNSPLNYRDPSGHNAFSSYAMPIAFVAVVAVALVATGSLRDALLRPQTFDDLPHWNGFTYPDEDTELMGDILKLGQKYVNQKVQSALGSGNSSGGGDDSDPNGNKPKPAVWYTLITIITTVAIALNPGGQAPPVTDHPPASDGPPRAPGTPPETGAPPDTGTPPETGTPPQIGNPPGQPDPVTPPDPVRQPQPAPEPTPQPTVPAPTPSDDLCDKIDVPPGVTVAEVVGPTPLKAGQTSVTKDIVVRYARLMCKGAKFPPIEIMHGVSLDTIYQGHHRFVASILSGKGIPSVIHRDLSPYNVNWPNTYEWSEVIWT